MRLLIITQAVDSKNQVLGFFVSWINEFAKQFEFVTVICLEKGGYDVPNNVKVLSLGKEEGQSRVKYLCRFYKYLWQEKKNYDVVFVHMNPVYILLGSIIWKLSRKKIALWYAHKSVDFVLKIAVFFSDFVFTSSEEGFRYKTSKLVVLGQGIKTELFNMVVPSFENHIRLIYVGRISRIKRINKILELLSCLLGTHDTSLVIVGTPLTKDDFLYKKELDDYLEKRSLTGNVSFLGGVANCDIPKTVSGFHFMIHTSQTGSMDKVVLEAMAAGVLVLSESFAFKDFLSSIDLSLTEDSSVLKYKEKILYLIEDIEARKQKAQIARKWVEVNHHLEQLIKNIAKELIK